MKLHELIPPVPGSWKRQPYAVVIEGKALSKRQMREREELLLEKENGKRTTYHREYSRSHAEEYNRKRRDEYAATKLGVSQEEMRAAAVRTMVAMGDQ